MPGPPLFEWQFNCQAQVGSEGGSEEGAGEEQRQGNSFFWKGRAVRDRRNCEGVEQSFLSCHVVRGRTCAAPGDPTPSLINFHETRLSHAHSRTTISRFIGPVAKAIALGTCLTEGNGIYSWQSALSRTLSRAHNHTPPASLTTLLSLLFFRVDDQWLSECKGGKSCKKDLRSWTLTAAKYVSCVFWAHFGRPPRASPLSTLTPVLTPMLPPLSLQISVGKHRNALQGRVQHSKAKKLCQLCQAKPSVG